MDQFSLVADLSEARDHFDNALVGLISQVKTADDEPEADFILALSDATQNFRKDIFPTYKSNRGRRPLVYTALREWVLGSYNTYLRPRLEADDICGILATHPKIIPGRKIIVSPDKDLRQVPGFHYDFKGGEIVHVDRPAGDRFFLTQVVTGDQVDGYPGLPGIGAKRAPAIVAKGWPGIVEAYEAKGLTEEDALVQARVARILQHTDYDFKAKEPILWSPSRTTGA